MIKRQRNGYMKQATLKILFNIHIQKFVMKKNEQEWGRNKKQQEYMLWLGQNI